MTAAPLIDLRTGAPERQQVRIDGKPYDIARPDDLSPLELHDLKRWNARLGELDQREGWGDADAREHDELVERIARLVLPGAPGDAIAGVGREGREAIVEAFLGARLLNRLQTGLIALATAALIGSSSRPGSSGTTGETPSDG